MRLVMFTSREAHQHDDHAPFRESQAGPAGPAERGRLGHVEPSGDIVDVEKAIAWWEQRYGRTTERSLHDSARTLDGLIADRHEDRWQRLGDILQSWRQATTEGDGKALACVGSIAEASLQLPMRPRSFRDFYAFEEHVRTARRRRGLDMVPEWYEFPVFYFSNTESFCGPDEPVFAPRGSHELDFELEVACVIGEPLRDVSLRDCHDAIAGYLLLNDWSARDIQRAEMKVGLGPAKGKDFATSLGPWFVTPDELDTLEVAADGRYRHQLDLTARVNGQTVSSGNLSHLYYSFEEMIERAARDAQLMPGDLIGSGTVGTGCILELGTERQDWLQPGDIVELSSPQLGTLRTPVIHRPGI